MKKYFSLICCMIMTFILATAPTLASEANLIVPNFKENPMQYNLLCVGILVSVIGAIFGLVEFVKIKKLKVHPLMEQVGNTIFETCKTYLVQQGKFLVILEILIALCIAYYFGFL